MTVRVALGLVLAGYASFVWWFVGAIEVEERSYEANIQKITNLPPNYATIVRFDGVKKGLVVPSWRWLDTSGKWAFVSNKSQIDKNYLPNDLKELAIPYGSWIIDNRLAGRANSALQKLNEDASHAGFPLIATSSYRSSTDQQALLDSSITNYGEPWAKSHVANPGESEHQLGLAVDLSSFTESCKTSFSGCNLSKETATWLQDNAHKYGFVLRYPPNKIDITGIAHEPWHFRFVDIKLATYAHDNNLVLDEILPAVIHKRPRIPYLAYVNMTQYKALR